MLNLKRYLFLSRRPLRARQVQGWLQAGVLGISQNPRNPFQSPV